LFSLCTPEENMSQVVQLTLADDLQKLVVEQHLKINIYLN